MRYSLRYFQESPLLPKDEPLAHGHRKVRARFRIQLQTCPVGLVGSKALQANESPRDIVRALTGQEVADQLATAAWNDGPPVLGIRAKAVELVRVDLIAD